MWKVNEIREFGGKWADRTDVEKSVKTTLPKAVFNQGICLNRTRFNSFTL
jgi:hypothetical protein